MKFNIIFAFGAIFVIGLIFITKQSQVTTEFEGPLEGIYFEQLENNDISEYGDNDDDYTSYK